MRTVISTILIGLLLLSQATPFAQATASKGDEHASGEEKIVARVNGEPIYEKELIESLQLRFNKRKKFGMEVSRPEVDYAIKMQVLDELIDSAVLYQAAMNQKELPDVEEEVNEKIKSLAMTFGGKDNYEKFLKTKDTSIEEKKDYFRKTFLVQAYFDKIGLTDPEIPENEIKALYEQQKNSFKNPEKVKFSQVFVPAGNDASDEQKSQARKIAEQAREMLLAGESFEAVANKLKEETGLDIKGGERGYIRKGILPVEVDEVAFSAMPWAISDIIESKFGYHVVMISDKRPASYAPYEKVRDFLRRYLQAEAVRRNVVRHTKELREKATIEIFLEKPQTDEKSQSPS